MATIEVPDKLFDLFEAPHGKLRWRGAYGGRGSAKSRTFATMAALRGYETRRRILCTRDIQASIAESFHADLRATIARVPWLAAHYRVTEKKIYGRNGTEFIFRGLRHNIESLRSLSGVDICIVEEAEEIADIAWRKLIPTIRAPGSEIWVAWNPETEGSPIDRRLRTESPPRSMAIEINYNDNPWFPPELEEQRLHDQDVLDPDVYAHIWEGAYLKNNEAQVLHGKWRIARFEPGADWDGPYHGLDFGFSQDPMACTRSWIHGDRLFIEREAGGKRIDNDDIAPLLKKEIPGIEKYEVLADNARPETISHLKTSDRLPRIQAAKKWSGSVADGIAYMRGFREIVIHERCIETKREARLYSHKVDRQSEQVLTDIVDAFNHYMDSIRYGHDKIIRRKKLAWGDVGSAR